MRKDLVSIIIPIYNVEDYLEECIISVIGQTYTNIEILLIDDGSTDNSLAICKKWKEKDERIRVFTKNNEGLGPTRNFGVKHAEHHQALQRSGRIPLRRTGYGAVFAL